MRNKIINWLIGHIEKDIQCPKEILTEEQTNGLLASLWDNPSFRNYVADRNSRLIYAIAGAAGSEMEPRDKTRLWTGQRVEILFLASRAKACAKKRDEDREIKKQASNPVSKGN